MGPGYLLALCAVLLGCSAYFSASEASLFSLSRIARRGLEGDRRGQRVLRLLSTPKRTLIAILLGNTFVNILLAAAATDALVRILGPGAGLGAAVTASTLAILVLGDILPKLQGVAASATMARLLAGPLALFVSASGWMLSLVERVADPLVARFLGKAPGEPSVTVDELESLVSLSEEQGALKRREKQLLEYILEFEQTVVREVMTPRLLIEGIDATLPPAKVVQRICTVKKSRMPVFRGDLDTIEGMLHTKDFLLSGGAVLSPSMREPYYVPEGKKINALLADFRDKGLEVAVVLDEHGRTLGLVTLEDILEEIFGEVYDEHETAVEPIQTGADGTMRVLGTVPLEDLAEALGEPVEAGAGVETVAGLVMERLKRIPRQGDSLPLGTFQVTIGKVAKRRVVDVTVRRES